MLKIKFNPPKKGHENMLKFEPCDWFLKHQKPQVDEDTLKDIIIAFCDWFLKHQKP